MAVIKGLAATSLRRSAGKLTFRNTIYGNVASQKIINMTNPQSIAQSYSRAKTKYLAKGYSLLKKIANHSIEGKASGAQTMNEWKRLNSAILQNVSPDAKYFYPFAKTFASQLPFDGILSKGSLSLNLQCVKDSAVVQKGDANDPIATLITCLTLSNDINLATVKMKDFINLIGCDYGDELCGVYQTSNAAIYELQISDNYVWNNAEIEYVTFADESKGNLNMFEASYKTGLYVFNPECLTAETRGTGTFMAFIVNDLSLKTTNLMAGVTRAAFISSAKIDGSWKRSSSRFESQAEIDNLIEDKVNAAHINAVYTYSEACETFQKSALPLNNAN